VLVTHGLPRALYSDHASWAFYTHGQIPSPTSTTNRTDIGSRRTGPPFVVSGPGQRDLRTRDEEADLARGWVFFAFQGFQSTECSSR